MNLPAFALRYRSVVIVTVAVATLWGIVTFGKIPRREDPEFTIRICQIVTHWPGATAEDMELLVTDPLEDAVSGVDEVFETNSTSTAGLSVLEIEIDETLSSLAVDNTWDKIRAEIDKVSLPWESGCGKPIVNANFGDTAAMVLAIYEVPPDDPKDTTRKFTPRQMQVLAERLEDDVRTVESVARTDLYGIQAETIYLETDAGTWSRLALTTTDLQSLLEARNIVAPGGLIETELSRFGLKPTGEFTAESQIDRLVVDRVGGRLPVYLKDLGIRVRRTYQDPPVLQIRYGSQDMATHADAIILSFTMKDGRNISDLGKEVQDVLTKARESWLPESIRVDVVSNQPQSVDDKISAFAGNLVQAIGIVMAVAFLLMGFRVAVVMATAIPLVILISVGAMPLLGVQLEQISIAALIIALGMLVDNAIEVCDNTHRFLHEGLEAKQAAIKGASQIAFPILIATLTTIAAFAPMLTLPGNKGEYIASLPLTVSATLMISWFLAMTLTTIMAYRMMKVTETKAPFFWVVDKVMWVIRRGKAKTNTSGSSFYNVICMAAIRAKPITLVIAFGSFFGAITLVTSGKVGTAFFPAADRAQFVIDIDLPEGTPIAHTRKVVAQLEQILRDQRNIDIDGEKVDALDDFVSYVGGGGPRFYLSLSQRDPGPNVAFMLVNTSDRTVVGQYIDAIRNEAFDLIPGARINPKRLDMGPSVDFPIQIRLTGPDRDRLQAGAAQVKDALRTTHGTLDVHDSWGIDSLQMYLKTDEDRAKLAGVTNASVARTSNAFFSGHYLTTYREGDHRVPIFLRLPPEQRLSLTQVDSMYVEGSHGKVPLDVVAEAVTDWVPGKIERFQQIRSIMINCRHTDGTLANSVLAEAKPAIDEIRALLPPGYDLTVEGIQKETTESQADMSFALQTSVLLIVMLLVIMYNSFVKPLLVLLAIPLATTGGIVGLWLTGKPLGFMANLGMLSLAGVVINAAIVLIEFVEEKILDLRLAGKDLAAPGERAFCGLTRQAFRRCVVEGSKMRILPIALTTFTTVGGLIPLALAGGPLFEPMAVVIIFGLLLSTALTLLVLPALLSLFVEVFRVDLVAQKAAEAAEASQSS